MDGRLKDSEQSKLESEASSSQETQVLVQICLKKYIYYFKYFKIS